MFDYTRENGEKVSVKVKGKGSKMCYISYSRLNDGGDEMVHHYRSIDYPAGCATEREDGWHVFAHNPFKTRARRIREWRCFDLMKEEPYSHGEILGSGDYSEEEWQMASWYSAVTLAQKFQGKEDMAKACVEAHLHMVEAMEDVSLMVSQLFTGPVRETFVRECEGHPGKWEAVAVLSLSGTYKRQWYGTDKDLVESLVDQPYMSVYESGIAEMEKAWRAYANKMYADELNRVESLYKAGLEEALF